MTKNIFIKFAIIIFSSVSLNCSPYGVPRTAAGTENLSRPETKSAEPNCVNKILDKLKEKTSTIQTYQGQFEYLYSQPLFDSKTLRKGNLYYSKTDSASKLRINFETLKQDDEKEQKYVEHIIFDGVWLTHIDYQNKQVKMQQLAEPNKPIEAFSLLSEKMPLVGFGKIDELKKEFEISMAEQPKNETSQYYHLLLKVREGSVYEDDYKKIDFWIDKKLFLPVEIIALSNEEDIYQIKLFAPEIDEKIDKKVFDFEIPKDFEKTIIPLKTKGSYQ